MLYMDANFFIFAVLDTTEKGEKARKILREIVAGKRQAITSVLTLDEILWVLRRNKKEEIRRKVIEDIYAIPNLEVKAVSALIPLRALEYIEKYNLKPRDAFHCACMEEFQINIIVSDDADFDKVKNITRLKIE
ncbi:MAG: type II toxin-antitoxin system VapC family toxin [Nanoarchaeota archaeon]